MAKNVSLALREPGLRQRLIEKKRLSREEIMEKIEASGTDWTLCCDLSGYTKQSDKNLAATCPEGHTATISLIDIVNNVRCKTCFPRRNAGRLNPAFKDINVFFDRLLTKFGEDVFRFDHSTYNGLYAPIEFQCAACEHVFTKAPRVLLNERYGCPKCAAVARGNAQRRSAEEFAQITQSSYGDRFTYIASIDQKYGNADYITRTCNECGTTQQQCVGNQLIGNGCSTCSQKRKHTTPSFIARAESVWGKGTFDYSQVDYVNNKHLVILTCSKGHTFMCSPSNHLSGKGCPHCAMKKFRSVGETEWLDSLNIPAECRNKWLTVNGQKFNVDGLINSTIYEYYGDYWHGNLRRFAPDAIHAHLGMTMKELNEHTVTRQELLKEGGYVVIAMWELDWMQLRKTRPSYVPL
jgi:predicted  nucleic acid-binding Zn-ribbon protein